MSTGIRIMQAINTQTRLCTQAEPGLSIYYIILCLCAAAPQFCAVSPSYSRFALQNSALMRDAYLQSSYRSLKTDYSLRSMISF